MKDFREKILQFLRKNSVGDLIKIIPSVEEENDDKKEEKAQEKKQENNAVVEVVSTVSSNEENQTEPSNSRKEALKNELLDLNEKLNKVEDSSALKTIEYTPLTTEEIESKAKEGVEEKYQLKKSGLDDNFEVQKSNAKTNEELIKENANNKKQTIDSEYLKFQDTLEKNAIKRGIARSSIVMEQLKELGEDKIKSLLLVDDDTAKNLKENSDKLVKYESDYQKAVNNLSVEKAIEIKEKINDLVKEQNDKIEQVLKYNNSVIKDQLYLDEKYGDNKPRDQEKTKIRRDMFEKAYAYYMSLPKEQALKELNEDSEIKTLLGNSYSMLVNYINGR